MQIINLFTSVHNIAYKTLTQISSACLENGLWWKGRHIQVIILVQQKSVEILNVCTVM